MAAPVLRVRNFLGVRKADVTLDRITLVAGLNGSGKSSLLEAAACAVLQTPVARGQSTKAKLFELVHHGMKAGSISLDRQQEGGVRVVYPSGDIDIGGPPVFMGTALGIGASLFSDLSPRARAIEIADRFNTKPTIEDLRAWFVEHPESGLHEPVFAKDGSPVDQIKLLWDRIDTSGWEAVHVAAKEHGSKTKGAWEQVTHKRWGAVVSKNWCPPELLPGEEYDFEKAQGDVAKFERALEKLAEARGVTSAELDALEVAAAQLEPALKQQTVIEQESARLKAENDLLVKRLRNIVLPMDERKLPRCPHCDKLIFVQVGPRGGAPSLSIPEAAAPLAVVEAAYEAQAEMERQITSSGQAVRNNFMAQGEVKAWVDRANKAHAELRKARAVKVSDDDPTAEVRELLAEARKRLVAIDAMTQATDLAASYWVNDCVVDALSPDGVRALTLVRRLGEINMAMSGMSATARMEPVQLTTSLALSYGGRELMSESEKWRCNLLMALLFGRQEGAKVLLVDRLDVVHPQARGGIVMLLRSAGIPSLVAMTAKDLGSVPLLEKAGMGTTLWIDAGTITPQ